MGNNLYNIVLCDTIHHPTPILKEWSYGLDDLGHKTTYLPIPESSLSQVDGECDILIYAGIPVEKLQEFEEFKKRYPNSIVIGATDHWKNGYEHFKGIVDFFIGCFESIPNVKKTFNDNGFDYHNVPLAANHKLFYKQNSEKVYDSCFIGTFSHGYRFEDKFLYPILDNPNYRNFLGGVNYNGYSNGFVPYHEHNNIRNQTKINLNFHVPYQKPNMGEPIDRVDCNQSVFNIALSGNFQLCDHPLVVDYFKGNVVLGDETNWLELFEYYLNNDKEREELAYNAMIIAQNEHTWVSRMSNFIELIEKDYGK
jgi:hypothetical protein